MRASVRTMALLALVPLVFLAPGAARAQTECKGLEQPACATNEGCSWVKAYKTSKGKDVSAFCRKKPERKKATEAASAPKG